MMDWKEYDKLLDLKIKNRDKDSSKSTDKRIEESTMTFKEQRDTLAKDFKELFYNETNMSANDYVRGVERFCNLYYNLTCSMLEEIDRLKLNAQVFDEIEQELKEVIPNREYELMLLGRKQ